VLRHRVCINVNRPDGATQRVIEGGSRVFRERILNFLFGKRAKVLVISPAECVTNVEIHALPGDYGGEDFV